MSAAFTLHPIGANVTELRINGDLVLFSYKTPVAANVDGKFYRTECRFTVTTSKHITQWLQGAKAEEKPQAFFDSLLMVTLAPAEDAAAKALEPWHA